MKRTKEATAGHAGRVMKYMTEDQRQIFGSVRSIVNVTRFDADAGAELARLLLGVKRQKKPGIYDAVHQYAMDILRQKHLARMRYTVDLVKDGEEGSSFPYLYPFPSFSFVPPIRRRLNQAEEGRSNTWLVSIGRSSGGVMYVEKQVVLDDVFFDVFLVEMAMLSLEPFGNVERLSLSRFGSDVRRETIELVKSRWGVSGEPIRLSPTQLNSFIRAMGESRNCVVNPDYAARRTSTGRPLSIVPGDGVNPINAIESLESLLLEWASWRMGRPVSHHGFKDVDMPDDEQ